MMKQIFSAVVMFCVLCASAAAQTKGKTKEEPVAQKVPALLPGLDKSLIDTTADPCTDFFKYACGNFSKLHPIPNDRSAYGTGAMVADHTEYVLHAMLEKAAAGGASRTPNEQKIGDSYAACMDVDTITQKGLTPLQMEFDRITALKSKDELPELLARFQLIGVTAFLNFGEQQDFKDARKQIAVVDQSGLGLPERDYYFRTGAAADKTPAQYVQHIINMFKLTGESDKKATSDAEAIMKLETSLAQVSMDITSRRDPNKIYHLMPVSDLATLAPAISWDRFIAASGAPKVSELNVAVPDFVKGMNSVIADTNLETIKTYLRWQLILATPATCYPKQWTKSGSTSTATN
jgi:putative endopeptidase